MDVGSHLIMVPRRGSMVSIKSRYFVLSEGLLIRVNLLFLECRSVAMEFQWQSHQPDHKSSHSAEYHTNDDSRNKKKTRMLDANVAQHSTWRNKMDSWNTPVSKSEMFSPEFWIACELRSQSLPSRGNAQIPQGSDVFRYSFTG